jgi:hypothetical protein
MSKQVVAILSIVAAVVLAAAIWAGVGFAIAGQTRPVVTEQRQVPDFTAVEMHGSGTLIITQGSTPGLVVEGESRVLDQLRTTLVGNTLVIDFDRTWFKPWTFGWDNDVVCRLTVTDLTRIEGHGSTDIEGQQVIIADRLEVSASGSGDITLGVQAQSLDVRTSGSADITLSGTADVLTFNSSGSSNLQSRDLRCRTATIDCSGSSDVEVNASQELNVSISGSGDVGYVGNPAIKSSLSGSGDIERLE